MVAGKWALIAAMSVILSVPAIAAVADDSSASFAPAVQSPSAKPSETANSDSSDHSESSDSSADDNIGDEGSPIDQMLDTDKARENLESRYENPADVSLPPKLLVPQIGSLKTYTSKTSSYSQFNVYQLQHHMPSNSLKFAKAPGLQVVQGQTATINSVPVNIDAALISFQTPAQDFFDGASKGLFLLGSSAVAMGGFILVRRFRKDHAHH